MMMSPTQLIGWTLVVAASVVGIGYNLIMYGVQLEIRRRIKKERREADEARKARLDLGPMMFVLAFAALELLLVMRCPWNF